jgi:hypothetical protein
MDAVGRRFGFGFRLIPGAYLPVHPTRRPVPVTPFLPDTISSAHIYRASALNISCRGAVNPVSPQAAFNQ